MEIWQLRQFQGLPLEAKVLKSQLRIREWYERNDGDVYVSFSGGKDSTVLLDLVRSLYPDVPAVFSDTGLEFPEIRRFVKTIPNVEWVTPDLTFRQVIEKHGYPVVSKEQSEWIHRVRLGNPQVYRKAVLGIMPDGRETKYRISKKWLYLLDAPFAISAGCCHEMKKKPLRRYTKTSGRLPYLGTMTCESMLRTQQWLKQGCNAFDGVNPNSAPMAFWLEEDVWAYIRTRNLSYSSIYDMGYRRTGCVFCMYGVHLEKEPNRFQRMKNTHPELWRYCMRDWDSGGLGLARVMDYLGIAADTQSKDFL